MTRSLVIAVVVFAAGPGAASEEEAHRFVEEVFRGLGAEETECVAEQPGMRDGGIRRCATIDANARSLKRDWEEISGDLSAIAEPTSSWIPVGPVLKRYHNVGYVPIRISFDKRARRIAATYWPSFPVCGNPALDTDPLPLGRTDVGRHETRAPLPAGVGNVTHPGRSTYVRYPAHRRPARRGKMTMQAVVLKDGTVGDVCILDATLPEVEVQWVAVNTVRKWLYEPALMDGNPVDAFITVRMDFEP